MAQFFREAMKLIERMSLQDWTLVLVAAMVVGAFFLRGFGSRSNY